MFALFDVGQFERMNRQDTDALLWALSWMSHPNQFTTLRRVALRHIGGVATLDLPVGWRCFLCNVSVGIHFPQVLNTEDAIGCFGYMGVL